MRQDEPEEYGEQAEEIIADLRRLAQQADAPPALYASIMARGQQLLPQPKPPRTWWRQLWATWQLRPLVWGPVIALVAFVAGVFVPLPSRTPPPAPLSDSLLQAPPEPVPVAPSPLQGASKSAAPLTKLAEPRSASPPATPAPLPSAESPRERQEGRARQAASQMRGDRAAQTAPPPVDITLTLPADLYERLLLEAAQQQTDLPTLLRQAIEAYMPSEK